jgi:hypothetical protein
LRSIIFYFTPCKASLDLLNPELLIFILVDKGLTFYDRNIESLLSFLTCYSGLKFLLILDSFDIVFYSWKSSLYSCCSNCLRSLFSTSISSSKSGLFSIDRMRIDPSLLAKIMDIYLTYNLWWENKRGASINWT